MLIISPRGEMKSFPADISVIGGYPGTPRGLVGAKYTSSAQISRTAGQYAVLSFDQLVWRNGVTSAPGSYFTVPETGWWLVNVYLQINAVAHSSELQMWSINKGNYFASRRRRFGATAVMNAISCTGKAYLTKGDTLYTFWHATQAVSTGTGEQNVGFGMWKTS